MFARQGGNGLPGGYRGGTGVGPGGWDRGGTGVGPAWGHGENGRVGTGVGDRGLPSGWDRVCIVNEERNNDA